MTSPRPNRPRRPRHGRPAPPHPRRTEGSRTHRSRFANPGRPAPSATPAKPQDSSWEHVAGWYDTLVSDRGTDFHEQVIIPGVLRLLDVKPREHALDLACGQGVVSRALHRAGASVTGVDLSRRLIDMARQRSVRAIDYQVADIHRLEGFTNGSFDAAVSVLGLQNVDPVEDVFAQVGRVLKPGGRIVAVILHPAFRIPRQSAWGWEESRKLQYRRIDHYLSPLKIPIDMRPFKSPEKAVTWTYHRPISSYVNGLAAAGLLTSALEEWVSHKTTQAGPRARGENRARTEIPLFLAFRAHKTAVTPSH